AAHMKRKPLQQEKDSTQFPSKMQIPWQLYSIFILYIIKETTACSLFCTCKWKNGKQTVECPNKNLPDIPDELDQATQVLEFSGNKLSKMTKELFLKKQLINLQRLYLTSCKIRSVHKDTFKGLTNLVELDLSDNLLESVPSAAFINCPALMKLTLNSNPINSLKKFAFNHLSYLNTLELSSCQIAEIEEGAFQGLHSLEWLRLDGNKLGTIRGRRTLPDNVKGVDLQKNPWECDCHIHDLSAFLKDFGVPLSVDPICDGPPKALRTHCGIDTGIGVGLPSRHIAHFVLSGTGGGEERVPVLSRARHTGSDGLLVVSGSNVAERHDEGTENKRSELFIYNANAGDNGTFICNADNAAGTSQSNFTIKIILKEDPMVIIVSFPLEYLLIAAVGVSVIGVLVLVVVAVLIIRCHRRRKRQQKREQTKEVTLPYQQNANKMMGRTWSACRILPRRHVSTASFVPKPYRNCRLRIRPNLQLLETTRDDELLSEVSINHRSLVINTPSANHDEDLMGYGVHPCDDMLSLASPARSSARSPATQRRYQLEQNPDLINGTESIGCRREGDGGEDERNHDGLQGERMNNAAVTGMMPIACLRGSADFYTDIRCIVDPEGYPIDYGLPKIPCRTQCNEGYYRTLPTNRIKRHSAANPLKRFSREAEFLSRSQDSPYDYQTDVRYTADGYEYFIGASVKVKSWNIMELYGSLGIVKENWKEYSGRDPRVYISEDVFTSSSINQDREVKKSKDRKMISLANYEIVIDIHGYERYPARVPDPPPQPPLDKFPEAVAPSSLPCCSDQWPTCVPANLHVINYGMSIGAGPRVPGQCTLAPGQCTLAPAQCTLAPAQCAVAPAQCTRAPAPKYVSKRCVGAQTDTESDSENQEGFTADKGESAVNIEIDAVHETLTESPDEGYEGEPSVV
ncbi:hypothetical protein NQ317_006955, partial [Molorchus minor]